MNIKGSISFRSALLYKNLLKIMPINVRQNKSTFGVCLLTMCGIKHIAMLEQSLYSVYKFWDKIPSTLIIVSDGTISTKAIEDKFHWWKSELEVHDWSFYANYNKTIGRHNLYDYARKDAFGKKYSAICALSEQYNLLWLDTDILFFRDFSKDIEKLSSNKDSFIYATEDWIMAYDKKVLESFPELKLNKAVNTGIVFCKGDFYTPFNFEEFLKQLIPTAMHFTEQSLLAIALNKFGCIKWGINEIQNFNTDIYSIGPTFYKKNWLSRHYTNNIRHLFWRDAFFLRIGIR